MASLRRFETTGAIAFKSLLKIAQVLDAVEAFTKVFVPPEFETLDEVLATPKARQRGRIS